MTFEPEEVRRALKEAAAMPKRCFHEKAYRAKAPNRELVEHLKLAVEDCGLPTVLWALTEVVGHMEPGNAKLDRLYEKIVEVTDWSLREGL